MVELKECTIRELCDTISDTYKGNDEYVVLVNTSDVLDGKILNHNVVENKNLKGQFKKTFKKNDILYSEIRPVNKRFAFIDFEDTDNYIASTKLMVLRHKDNVLPEFLFALLKSNYIISELQHLAETRSGTFPQITFSSELAPMKVKLPDKQTQHKIVSVLSSIEHKIDVNEKINNNLEQQMQTIFNKFISEKAIISKTSVENVVLTANTGADAIQKAPIVDYDTGIRCVRVGDMTNNRSFYDWGYTKVTEEVFNRYQLHKNDIIVTRTASLGLNMIISEDLQAVYNNGLIRLSINDKKVLPLFIYRQFQTDDFTNYISRIESETSVRPNMKINYLLKYEFVLPSLNEQNKLIDSLQPMIEQQSSLVNENNVLKSLRDILLPKLMSGELDVSDVDL